MLQKCQTSTSEAKSSTYTPNTEMTKDNANHLAFTCVCGGVNFSLLKSGNIECNKCSTKLDGVKWFSGGLGAQINRAIKAEDERDVLLKQLEAQPALTDDDIEKVIAKGVKSGSISWTGFREDDEGKYTVPILSEHHCQIARAIETHCRGGANHG